MRATDRPSGVGPPWSRRRPGRVGCQAESSAEPGEGGARRQGSRMRAWDGRNAKGGDGRDGAAPAGSGVEACRVPGDPGTLEELGLPPGAHRHGDEVHLEAHRHPHVEAPEDGRPVLGFVGAGQVATALAVAFQRAGWVVGGAVAPRRGPPPAVRRARARGARLPGPAGDRRRVPPGDRRGPGRRDRAGRRGRSGCTAARRSSTRAGRSGRRSSRRRSRPGRRRGASTR